MLMILGMNCAHPELLLNCEWCGEIFRCGQAPHDEEGVLCPRCGRGEDLQALRDKNGPTLQS